jgi:hypothetical protein
VAPCMRQGTKAVGRYVRFPGKSGLAVPALRTSACGPRADIASVFSSPYALLWLRLFEAAPFPYGFEGESCRRLSGFGKRGIGACSETCEQFREFGVQSIAARRGERVKRKKRHVGPLGQHVILRRNVLPAFAIFQPARHSITPLLALKSKKRACLRPGACFDISARSGVCESFMRITHCASH